MFETPKFSEYYDAVIVGGRCAGASAAMLLARAGAKVLLIDRQGYGTDRLSTHALMRGGVLQLHRWGLLPRLAEFETPEVRRTTFHYGAEKIAVDIKPEHGLDHLSAPRRTVLDRVLVDAAAAAGADVRHGVLLTGLRRNPFGRVTGVELRDLGGHTSAVSTGIVIGADGRQSSVARLVGAKPYIEAKHSSATVYGYFSDLKADGFHWYYAPGTTAGVIPTNRGAFCVFVCLPPDRFKGAFRKNLEAGFMQEARRNSSELHADLQNARLQERYMAFAGVPGYFRQSHGAGWALVGDAGYFKDPLTAHGITDALRDAELLSRAVLAGGSYALRMYQAERDALSMPLFDLTDSIASFEWDLETIKRHHIRLNKVLKDEVWHMMEAAHETLQAA